MYRNRLALVTVASLLALGACSTGNSSPTSAAGALAADAPAVLSVLPAAAATGVDPAKPVIVTFNIAMLPGMEMLVVVHEGSVTGPQVTGISVWSADRRVLTFTPTATLKAKTTYVVHFAPSLQGTNGKAIDLSQCTKLGGQYVTGGMMGSAAGGMMNGSWGPGMMGAGWKASDGTYGMLFTFTTA
jgi:hypothetical protein